MKAEYGYPLIGILFCEECGRYTMQGYKTMRFDRNRARGGKTLCEKCFSSSTGTAVDEKRRAKIEKTIEILRASIRGMLDGCGIGSVDDD